MNRIRVTIILLVICLTFSSTGFVFAYEGIVGEEVAASTVSPGEGLELPAEAVLESSDTEVFDDLEEVLPEYADEEVCEELIVSDDSLVAEGEYADTDIPLDADGEVVVSTEGTSLAMSLPEEVDVSEAAIADDGTIVYEAAETPTTLGVQVVQGGEGEGYYEAVRIMVAIEDATAPHEYSFTYDLPEGAALYTDEEYAATFCSNEDPSGDEIPFTGEILVADAEGAILETVDPAWAYDANQNPVETYYRIEGSTLVQVVAFDETSAFPIIADPPRHPPITKTFYLKKSQVLEVRNRYTGSTAAVLINGAISLACLRAAPPVGAGWTLITVMGGCYYTNRFSTWDKIYTKMNKKYAKITIVYRWVGGQSRNAYVPTGKISCVYVNSKK